MLLSRSRTNLSYMNTERKLEINLSYFDHMINRAALVIKAEKIAKI